MPETVADESIHWANLGFRIVPLWWPEPDGSCSCGSPHTGKERDVGKHPIDDLVPREDGPDGPLVGTGGVSKATSDIPLIGRWLKKYPEMNYGIRVGEKFIVLDFDSEKSLAKFKAAVAETGAPLPETMTLKTGRGIHIWFSVPEGTRVPGTLDIIETIKHGNAYVVGPGSRHVSGRAYSYITDRDTPIAECPRWILDRFAAGAPSGPAAPLPDEVHEGEQRPNFIFSYARTLFRARGGLSDPEVLEACRAVNAKRCKPPLDDAKVVETVTNAGKYGRATTNDVLTTDMGNAVRYARDHRQSLRYSYDDKRWFYYDGKRWAKDSIGENERCAKQTVRGILAEASQCADDEERQRLAKWAITSQQAWRIEAMLKLAREEVSVLSEHQDRDPWAFNCLSGTVDLKTGDLRPHRAEDLITKLAPVEYVKGAQCPKWKVFLATIFADNAEIIDFSQRAVGYSLTGMTSEQVIFILYGLGANGKTQFMAALEAMTGDYAKAMTSDALTQKYREQGANEDIAELAHARVAVATETQAGRRLDEEKIKRLTGGDKLKARFLYGHFFEFYPSFKVWYLTNHLPRIRGTDHAIWRRILEVPFKVKIREEERVKDYYKNVLGDELPGIFQWALAGCLEWQANGLNPPDDVLSAVEEYRDTQDLLAQFINEECRAGDDETVLHSAITKSFNAWLENAKEKPVTSYELSLRLEEKGLVRTRLHGGKRAWRGISLLTDDEMFRR